MSGKSLQRYLARNYRYSTLLGSKPEAPAVLVPAAPKGYMAPVIAPKRQTPGIWSRPLGVTTYTQTGCVGKHGGQDSKSIAFAPAKQSWAARRAARKARRAAQRGARTRKQERGPQGLQSDTTAAPEVFYRS